MENAARKHVGMFLRVRRIRFVKTNNKESSIYVMQTMQVDG